MTVQAKQHVYVLKRHFDPTFEMLSQIVTHCPDELWCSGPPPPPVWQQLYHVMYYIDFWIRDDYEEPSQGADQAVGVPAANAGADARAPSQFLSMTFDKGVSFDLAKPSTDHLSREELSLYLERLRRKTEHFFESLRDDQLLQPVAAWTCFNRHDVILSQVRHIQHHVGCCNAILARAGQSIGWLPENEGEPEADEEAQNRRETVRVELENN